MIIKNKMSRYLSNQSNLLIVFIMFTLVCFSNCKTKDSSSPIKLTQAILKQQNFEFDNARKDSISGDYVDLKSINIPIDLPGQNKWLMFEGPVLENDKVAFRFYGDSRHRSDIYGKTVPDLVMDTVSWNYHDIMNWGSDILKVGNSLGIGSPAILFKDSIYCFTDWDTKTIEVTENADNRSAIKTTFYGLKIADKSFDLVQEWSIIPGVYYSEIELKLLNQTLPEDMKFVTGIVKHLEDFEFKNFGSSSAGFNYGNQSFHHQDLGMAIIVNNTFKPKLIPNELSHVIVFDNNQSTAKYKMMAGWSAGSGPKSAEEFSSLVEEAVKK